MKCVRKDCDGEATHYWINSFNDPVLQCEKCATQIKNIYQFSMYPVTPLIKIHRNLWEWSEDTKKLGVPPHYRLKNMLDIAREAIIVVSKVSEVET